MSNTWTGNKAPHTIAVPDRAVQEHNRGTKLQVEDAIVWKQVPPGIGVLHTMVTKQEALVLSSSQLDRAHPNECRI